LANLVARDSKVDDNQLSSGDTGPAGLGDRIRCTMALRERAMAGYSGTPLAKKLGIKPGTILRPVQAPENYLSLIDPLPENATVSQSASHEIDIVHLFVKQRSELAGLLQRYETKIKQNGAIWVSWPKKSSGIPSEITEDTVRDVALPMGLVDIKVCAVDDVWSGLKLVIRKENRK
jgi:hypothetical protein